MEMDTQDETNYVAVRNPEEGCSSDGSASADTPPEIEPMPQAAEPIYITARLKILAIGLISASPTLLLIGFGARPSIASIGVYVGLLLSTTVFVHYVRVRQLDFKVGAIRWCLGFVVLFLTSSWKSGQLLAKCDNMAMKGVLYAITALWECSNAVLIIGGKNILERNGIKGQRDVILYALAPCQIKFGGGDAAANSLSNNTCQEWCLPWNQFGKRSIHITLCSLGAGGLYYVLGLAQIQKFYSSFIPIELECMAIMASMAVVALDIPSHLWQLIHDILMMTPLNDSTNAPKSKVILPYGWVYSSPSTREFWSKWSRPATQLLRHLIYHPLGGRNRWYISIPVMFLLNASSHFDLSYALVGERSEVYWILLFGTMAVVAMMEVVGDRFFVVTNLDGNISVSTEYWYVRAFVAHASLRAVLYIMVHLCLKTSLANLVAL